MSFAGSDANLLIGEIDVLNAEAEGFVEAESGAIEQFHEEFLGAGQIDDDGRDLFFGEHRGKGLRTLGKLQILQPGKILFDHIPIEEENGAHRLILRGSGDVTNRCEVIEIIDHLLFAEVLGVDLLMEYDETVGPGHIGFLGRAAIVCASDCQADLIEEFVFFLHGMMCWGEGGTTWGTMDTERTS